MEPSDDVGGSAARSRASVSDASTRRGGMKQLILLRHAKSSWKNGVLGDVDRPLSERGNRDAPRMGKRLLSRQARPGLVLASHASAAQRTAKLVARAFVFPRAHQDRGIALSRRARRRARGGRGAGRRAFLPDRRRSQPGAHGPRERLLPSSRSTTYRPPASSRSTSPRRVGRTSPRAPAKLAYYDYPKNPELFVTRTSSRSAALQRLAPVFRAQQSAAFACRAGPRSAARTPAAARAAPRRARCRSRDSADLHVALRGCAAGPRRAASAATVTSRSRRRRGRSRGRRRPSRREPA